MRLKFNKTIIAAVLSVVVIGTVATTTYAFLSSNTQAVTNTFTIGSVDTDIYETIEEGKNKIVQISNVGKNDCLVRVRVEVSPSDAAEITGLNKDDWTEKQKDGFYYYKRTLKAPTVVNGKTVYYATEPLFTGYEVLETADGKLPEFEIGVYQEAVQSVVYTDGVDEQGKQIKITITDPTKIWEYYDTTLKGQQ